MKIFVGSPTEARKKAEVLRKILQELGADAISSLEASATNGALLYMGFAMYEMRPTGSASLRSEQGAVPLAPLRGYPCPWPYN